MSDPAAPTPATRRAFVSHSSKDDRYVQELVQLARSFGYDDVFNDGNSIPAGTQFWPRIEEGIRGCEAFVVVLSTDSVKSEWVDREIRLAQSLGKNVIPVRIDDCKPPAALDGCDILDFRPGRGERQKIAASRISRHAAAKLFGREKELVALDAAWANPHLNVYSLVAWGGAGKTSLVAEWVKTRFQAKGWPGVERYFDWSFYSQGTGENRQTSSDQFIHAALTFFGDPDPVKGSPWERGERLGELVRRHRTLLVLDGIEPLQYPPTDKSGQAGRLKDAALDALLQSLAAVNPGLCVVTTREHLKNIDGHATTEEQKLDRLAKEAAVALLRHLQIVGTDEELHAAWKDAGGHALTLHLLGRFLADAHGGDIRRYKEVDWAEAEEERDGRSAFKVMIAYENWLAAGGAERQRELAVLRLTGLFDRPMSRGCLDALRAEPAIAGLTDSIVGLKEPQWNLALKRLAGVELLSVTADSIDAHPLIREYFARQLRDTQPEAFKEAHSRLFDYLCKTTPYRPDTLQGLEPLYEAVSHGCLAGRHQEACNKVYVERILRGTDKDGSYSTDGFYSTRKLGAIGANLAAVATFFDQPWNGASSHLNNSDQAQMLYDAAYYLRALGRLTEAVQPMKSGLEMAIQQGNWKEAADRAGSMSELKVTLGRLTDAVSDAHNSVTYADQSGSVFHRLGKRTAEADAMHQSGKRLEAGNLFEQAEMMQKDDDSLRDQLFSLPGFRYSAWLLAPVERAMWQILNQRSHSRQAGMSRAWGLICDEVECRATAVLKCAKMDKASLLTLALGPLTLAGVGLIGAILANPVPQPMFQLPHVTDAINGLRAAGQMDKLPLGLLTAALYHFVRGEDNRAKEYLNETQQIAERGPMPLFLADVHLHRARMFRDKAELAKAAKLIRELGYGRRYDELADAEEVAKGWA